MNRYYFHSRDRRLSYVDYGGNGEVIILLHGHLGNAAMYSRVAKELIEDYRVIAMDQQGHGYSDWGKDYKRDEYIADIHELYSELGIERAILIGHSLGGVNAYQFAARYPEKVDRLIIEDIGTVINDDLSFLLEWPSTFDSMRELIGFLKSQGIDNYIYFLESAIPREGVWTFSFDAKGLVQSQINLNGDWQEDWYKVSCPLLLLHGEKSDVLSHSNAMDIINRENIEYRLFKDCGHTIRDKDYHGFIKEIKGFI